MTTGPDRALRRRLWVTRLTLLSERLVPALLPGAGVAGLFLILALSGLFAILPGTVHAILLGLFGFALLFALRGLPAALTLPGEDLARRRLERDNHIPHRALEALDDRLAGSETDPVTAALWQAHRARAAERAKDLHLHAPHPVVARHDPFGLRAAVLLGLVVVVAASGATAPQRLAEALVPRFGKDAGTPGVEPGFTAWITPPAYTRLAPIYLGGQGLAPGERLRVTAGATVMARLYGVGSGAIAFGEVKVPLDAVEDGTFAGEVPVQPADRLALVGGGGDMAAWPLEVVADAPPVVVFAQPPASTEQKSLRIAFAASDDYGVQSVNLQLRLGGAGEPLVIPLGGATGRPEAKGTAFRDLTASPWAGLDVTATLVASDALGQTGESDPVTLTLPERAFRHPVARAIVAARKQLVAHPAERRKVAEVLAGIADNVEAYEERKAVYLGLGMAVLKLLRHRDGAQDGEVVDLLWAIALDLDSGRVGGAQAQLRAAQDALEQALENGASDAEIARLMAEMRAAMDEYLRALTEEALRGGLDAGELRDSPDGQAITGEDIQRMLDEAQRAAETGSREAARQMLSQLREMLENLQAMPAQPGDAEAGRALGESMEKMGGLLREQSRLRDQSFAEQQRRESGTMPGDQGEARPGDQGRPRPGPGQSDPRGQGTGQGDSLSDLAKAQEALRRQLGDILGRLGETGLPLPDALTRADRAMDAARSALAGNDPAAAAQAQGEALDALRQGLQAMGEQMARQLGVSRGQGAAGDKPGGERDPLGRPRPGQNFGNGDDVRIPTEAEAKRVREILEELQRRAGDRTRSEEELDYIRRLIERF